MHSHDCDRAHCIGKRAVLCCTAWRSFFSFPLAAAYLTPLPRNGSVRSAAICDSKSNGTWTSTWSWCIPDGEMTQKATPVHQNRVIRSGFEGAWLQPRRREFSILSQSSLVLEESSIPVCLTTGSWNP